MQALQKICHLVILAAAVWMTGFAGPSNAADRERVDAFLEVTGFGVALESIRLSADSAPDMLGIDAEAFGSEWSRLVREVFDTDVMLQMGSDILTQTLSDDTLEHAAAFYALDLGKRLVTAENASHMNEDGAAKSEAGAAILSGLQRVNPARVALLEQLNAASDVEDSSIRAIQEVQIRFLMAAAGAGVIRLQMEEPDLREAVRSQEAEMRVSIKKNALEGSAYTYQAFSDAEMLAYAQALEHPKMQEVYALMNAVQYEIMANRFEAVAQRLAGMMDVLKIDEVAVILQTEGLEYAQTLNAEMLNGQGGPGWQLQVDAIYSPQRMTETLRGFLEAELQGDMREQTIDFFASGVGAQVITLENAARAAISDQDIENAARTKFAELEGSDDPRLARIAALIDSGDMIDRNVTAAMNSNYQFMRGLADGGAVDMTEQEMLAEVGEQQDEITEDTTGWLYGYAEVSYALGRAVALNMVAEEL